MATITVAAVQAAYVLMDREATVAKVERLMAGPAARAADLVWMEPGNTVIVGTNGELLAGPARHEETILTAELELAKVLSARRLFDPVGHYHRPDVFRLAVDTEPRPVVSALRHGSARTDGDALSPS